ncbi:MAG: ATP-binding protein [Planctomycetes bacterium]|nr:ATP-binding protein [Planctomycetota bacterium]
MLRVAKLFTRQLAPRLREALADTPAVLIHGPRQSGKTTLARVVGEPRGYRYLSFDDESIAGAARSDPVGFVSALPPKTILDEVQRVPEIFTSLKAAIDRRRAPGRFVLTGSAHVLFVPALADSLAGRLGILQLHPLAQCEIEDTRPRFLDTLFRGRFRTGLAERLGGELAERIAAGGYPAALARRTAARRRAWYRDYVEAQIQRDVRDLARIRSLDALPKLLALAASQTARLVNVAELSAPFELTRQSIHEYVTLLERVFLLERLPSWHRNRMSRLVKRPKLHLRDTGLACALLGLDAAALREDRESLGALLETFALQELRRQASWRQKPIEFSHFRDRDDFEVDIVLEQGPLAVAGVEVKAAASVGGADFRGLRKLRDMAGRRFVAGVVLYDGSATIRCDDRLFAVPLRALWETPCRAGACAAGAARPGLLNVELHAVRVRKAERRTRIDHEGLHADLAKR